MSNSLRRSPLDEGYSEHPLTVVNQPKFEELPSWLAEMSTEDRAECILDIMSKLPTSEVWDIVGRLKPRLKMDFSLHLPSEICLRILGFLDPVSLIRTARASRHWQMLCFDRKLWEQLYIRDGFRVIHSEVIKFEFPSGQSRRWSPRNSFELNPSVERRTRGNIQQILPNPDGDDDNRESNMVKQTSIFGPASTRDMRQSPLAEDSIMMDAPILSADSDKDRTSFSSIDGGVAQWKGKGVSPPRQGHVLAIVDRSSGEEKLNWHYLYTQRRRLEANWEAGKFTNFQLPHPHYPEEGHTECIYTIQHTQNYLVSGSRDKTIRIWNLDTRRLALPPLAEHEGSVLCLQFDPDPEEDIIVSGSSDATVIIWRFSTGKVIQRLKSAHRESVLNVKFDKNVLVTCSKDKTIKVFNRRSISEQSLMNDTASIQIQNLGFENNPVGWRIIPPYTNISKLKGHGAAVNAVQVLGDEVVSASGDRTVKIWNWRKNTCTRTLIGHSKGIACVQYDGRRIVSGSSDNEVKVFDRESGLEVASLRGHTNLVRTVQAGFGDLPYSAEEEREDAKRIDREYFKAVNGGIVDQTYQSSRLKNAGSSRPEDITAFGAKLPPGGGGCKYSRIVSGSYDESIHIWRRDKEGVWKPQHTLRQEEGSRAAIRMWARTPRKPNTNPAWLMRATSTVSGSSNNEVPLPDMANLAPEIQINSAIASGANGLLETLNKHPELLNNEYLRIAIARSPEHTRNLMSQVLIAALQAKGYDTRGLYASLQNDAFTTAVPSVPNLSGMSNVGVTLGGPAHHPIQNPHPQHARVFKLQFDARRIICCSQTPTIVGWDFANGDQDIIEASRFFAPME
ncbi:putative f-box wd-40 repeat-containing protein [Botrytis fragariae]|uniref:Putative f-box wd-40 repeat-containing protein n=1 Tax=Botrytis fragariae TaxID=1964551 RepID=A0A8H6AKF4_9HELO|nr:putative f-box wd-40 repeat-containing protein [Botrytis fragariae]KAF5868925.1 putative f-box wd-40 repeat-containing protein [Botrytis fragariae]